MQIESLKIRGIGPFVGDIVISAMELDEIVAVTGNNGAGKTFLLECIPGALYGYFPFRMYKQQGVSIYDMVTPGLDAFIEMIRPHIVGVGHAPNSWHVKTVFETFGLKIEQPITGNIPSIG